jgi:hypothetical protein
MSDEPLDLRSLADVDAPDVVHDALRTFRRRVLTRYVWITLAVVLALGALVWGLQPHTLQERIDRASPVYQPQASWQLAGMSVGLARVVDLGDTVGMRFAVVPLRAANQGDTVRIDGQLQAVSTGDGFDTYIEVPKTTDGIYRMVPNSGAPGSVTIDLGAMRVPEDVWKEQG